MEFDAHKAIYLQIVDLLMNGILENKWLVNDRVPSVRELASSIEVNPNTVMRAYSYLQEKGVIENKRGIGFFVDPNAFANIKKIKKDEFMITDLPRLAKNLNLLGISIEELKQLLQN
jgi:GntR family transcriptional regulator